MNASGAAKFVGKNGQLKPSTIQASHITFDKGSEHMGRIFPTVAAVCLFCVCVCVFAVFLSNCVLSFHKHGMQGKSLATQQVSLIQTQALTHYTHTCAHTHTHTLYQVTAEVADGSKVFHLLGSYGYEKILLLGTNLKL